MRWLKSSNGWKLYGWLFCTRFHHPGNSAGMPAVPKAFGNLPDWRMKSSLLMFKKAAPYFIWIVIAEREYYVYFHSRFLLNFLLFPYTGFLHASYRPCNPGAPLCFEAACYNIICIYETGRGKAFPGHARQAAGTLGKHRRRNNVQKASLIHRSGDKQISQCIFIKQKTLHIGLPRAIRYEKQRLPPCGAKIFRIYSPGRKNFRTGAFRLYGPFLAYFGNPRKY